MSRREFPAKVKVAAFQRAKGHCEKCSVYIVAGAQYDHDIPDALGGEPVLENCVVLCGPCHREKTSTLDVPMIAKAKRIEAKRMNAKKSRSPLPGSKASKWKRRMDGSVVRREP